MSATIETLRQLSFFAKLGDDTLRKMALILHKRTYSPGQVIILEGEPCQAVYFVAQGLVRARRMSLEGREHVLGYVGRGEPFNLVPAIDGSPSRASVDAVTEATLYIIPCRRFREIMRVHHDVALAVMERLAAEVRRLSDMVEDLALHTVRSRLARFLLTHASTGPSSPAQAEGLGGTAEERQSRRHWTQEEIATHIGTVREVVGRALRTFATEGLVRRQRGRLVMVDREGLEREAAGR